MSNSVNSIITNQPNNILFLGLGGAGQRHLRCCKKLFPNAKIYAYRFSGKTPLLREDFTVNNHDTIENKYGLTILNSFDEAKSLKADLVIIATPTNSHTYLALEFATPGNVILVEKPAVLTKSEAITLLETVLLKDSKLIVSFQRFYDPAVVTFRRYLSQINQNAIQNINIKVSSDVRTWHPYEDYRELYACRSELGGGVINTECHELALILDYFGSPTSVELTNFSKRNLGDVEDSAQYRLGYDNIPVYFDLNFLGDIQERKIVVTFMSGKIELDLLNREILVKRDGNISNTEKFDEVTQDQLYTLQLLDIFSDDYTANHYSQIVEPMAMILEDLKLKMI